jgi:hypothetical protein
VQSSKGEKNMAITQAEKDELKLTVLLETEKMFSKITGKYQTRENHDKLYFLLDLESAMKERLVELNTAEKE